MRITVVSATATLALMTMAVAVSGCSSSSKSSSTAGGAAATQGSSTAGAAGSGTSGASSTPGTSGGAAASGINVCNLLSVAQATSLAGKTYTSSQNTTLSPGVDQCTYAATNDDSDLEITVYQSNSGVTWDSLMTVLSSVGTTSSVSGIGDKAQLGAIEIDAQSGSHLLAVEGAGGTVSGHPENAEAVMKAVIAALG